MAKQVVMYESEDGTLFHSEEKATQHNELLAFLPVAKRLLCDPRLCKGDCTLMYTVEAGERVPKLYAGSCTLSAHAQAINNLLQKYKILKKFFSFNKQGEAR